MSPATGTRVALQPPSGVALRTVLDLSSQVLCVCDLDGRIVWWNEGFARVLGYGGSEIAGAALLDFVDEGGREALLAAGLGQSEGHSGPVPSEVTGALARVQRRDGELRSVEWTVRVDRGRALVFLAGRDVTDRAAAEQEARVGEARLRAILAHSPSAVYVKDLSCRYLLVNEAWADLAGRDVEEMIGRTDADCQPANAAAIAEMELAATTAAGPAVTDLRLATVGGQRDLMVVLFPLPGPDGAPYAFCAIATEVTDRKELEAAVVERERLLETVLTASPDIISLIDAEGRISRVSAAAATMLGHPPTDPSDAALFGLVHPEDFDAVASDFIAMVTGSRNHLHARYRVRNAEGAWVTVDSRSQAVVDDDGAFRGAVVVTRDVTERLRSEEHLETLRQAAEQASRAKSEFLSRMSHELRTPLNAILGFSQLLEMDELPVPQSDSVDHILRAGRHLLELIDEVLDIARIESGHLELAIRPVLVSEVVAEAVGAVRAMADRAEVVVQNGVDPDEGPAVLADRQRLLQVINNLVSNAVKYNRPGGRVDVTCPHAPEGRVRIAVSDTGQGIAADNLERVFEPFERLGAGQSGVEGTGVGLSLARRLVDHMQGSLEASSVPEVGSTFTVELPLALLPDDHAAGPPRGGAAMGAPSFRVLLVEENLTSLELVERVLSRRPGVGVLAAMHGRLALDLIRQQRPDLVLLDLRLPDMAGAALLEELGRDPVTAAIPVALLSDDESGHQVRRLLGRGVAGQLAKPIDVRALLSLVDAVRAATGR